MQNRGGFRNPRSNIVKVEVGKRKSTSRARQPQIEGDSDKKKITARPGIPRPKKSKPLDKPPKQPAIKENMEVNDKLEEIQQVTKQPKILTESVTSLQEKNISLSKKIGALKSKNELLSFELNSMKASLNKILEMDKEKIEKTSSDVWLRMHRHQASQIVRLKLENERLRVPLDMNRQLYGVLESALERLPKEACSSSLFITLSQAISSLDALFKDQNSHNWSSWDIGQAEHQVVKLKAKTSNIYEEMFSYEGFLVQKLELVERIISGEENGTSSARVLRDLILQENHTVRERNKRIIESNIGKIKVNEVKQIHKQAKLNDRNMLDVLRLNVTRLEPILNQNIKTLSENNHSNKSEFVKRFFEFEALEKSTNPDYSLASCLIKLTYFDYLSTMNLFSSRLIKLEKYSKDFAENFVSKIADPVYQVFNVIDNMNLSVGQNQMYSILRSGIVSEIEKLAKLEKGGQMHSHETIFTLQTLDALSNAGKQIFDDLVNQMAA